jgi:cytochrome c biogenesis factor
MTADTTVGHWSLVLGLGLSIYGMLAGWIATRRGSASWSASARGAVLAVFFLVSAGVGLLEWALLTDDFTLRYVALNSSRGTPLLYKVSALWGALEGSLLLWEWLLVGFTAVVVFLYRKRHADLMPWVTIVLLSEALLGVKASVGAPFFNLVNLPILLLLLLLMGVGPLIAWRRASRDNLSGNFLVPALAGAAAGVLLVLFGYRDPLVVSILALSVFVMSTMAQDIWRGLPARRPIDGGWGQALASVMARNHRRYGGFIVHLGVVVIFVAIAGSSGYGQQVERTLSRGEAIQLGRYLIRFEGLSATEASNHFRVTGGFALFNDQHQVGRLEAAKLFYPRDQQPMARVAIRSTWQEDLYLVLTHFARDGSSATVKATVNPLVGWIWFGGWIVTLGIVYALLPDRRRKGVAVGVIR